MTGLLRRAAPVIYIFAIAMAMTAAHVAKYNVLSPIDELRHLDYSMRLTEGELPKLGDLLHQEAMRTEACRGVDSPHEDPPCDTDRFDPRDFRDKGYQTATAHPPTYYLTVGLAARAFEGVGLFHDFVDPARLLGGVLLGLGLMFSYFAGLRLGMRKGVLLAVLTLIPTASSVMHSSSTVNPDAAAVFAGGIVLLAAVRWEQGELSTPWLVGAGALATGIKLTNLLVVICVAGWLLARSPEADRVYDWFGRTWRRVRGNDEAAESPADDPADEVDDADPAPSPRRDLFTRAAAYLVVGAGAAITLWLLFDRLRATIDPAIVPQNQILKADGFPAVGRILATTSGIMVPNVFSWFPPVDGYDPVAFQNAGVRNGRLFVFFILAAAMLVATLRATRRDRVLVLGAVGTVVAIFGAPAFLILNYFVSDIISEPTGRYGMSLLPVFAVVLAFWVRTRAATLAVWIAAITIYALQFATIVNTDIPSALAR